MGQATLATSGQCISCALHLSAPAQLWSIFSDTLDIMMSLVSSEPGPSLWLEMYMLGSQYTNE